MFYGCNSLRSLNLSHFNLDSTTSFSDMFINCNENLIYCINESNMKVEIKTQLESFQNNCFKICTMQSFKFISENIQCIESCSYDEIINMNIMIYVIHLVQVELKLL